MVCWDVELVRRASGDRTLCERVEKIRVVVKLEVASRCDHELHAWDQWIAERHVIHDVGPYETGGTLSVFPSSARKRASYHARLEEGQSAGAAPLRRLGPMNPPLVNVCPLTVMGVNTAKTVLSTANVSW